MVHAATQSLSKPHEKSIVIVLVLQMRDLSLREVTKMARVHMTYMIYSLPRPVPLLLEQKEPDYSGPHRAPFIISGTDLDNAGLLHCSGVLELASQWLMHPTPLYNPLPGFAVYLHSGRGY